ncbi:MAG: hypothetical protein JWM80_4424, partial [Cyanobacteria bacterium RYN_339]|nr:hypothetical protein [Cyanobacteria bacterium RYN_339]
AKTELLGRLSAPTRPLTLPSEPAVAPIAAQPGADPVQTAAEGALQRLAGAVNDVRHVSIYNADRVAIVERGVAVHARPGERPEVVCAGVSGQVVAIATALAMLFRERPPVLQRSQVAVFQATELRRELFKTDQELKQLQGLAPARALAAVQTYRLAPLRGKALPVANFPRTFAGDPILVALFPPLTGSPSPEAR